MKPGNLHCSFFGRGALAPAALTATYAELLPADISTLQERVALLERLAERSAEARYARAHWLSHASEMRKSGYVNSRLSLPHAVLDALKHSSTYRFLSFIESAFQLL